MAAIVYPPSLPCPSAAGYLAAERRLLTSLPGVVSSRPFSRDRQAGQPVEFIFTHEELAVFTEWVDKDLSSGAAWFSASWPQPQGGTGVRRFVGVPGYPEYLPRVGWRVSAQVEVRGRGELPLSLISGEIRTLFSEMDFSAEYHAFAGSGVDLKQWGSGAGMNPAQTGSAIRLSIGNKRLRFLGAGSSASVGHVYITADLYAVEVQVLDTLLARIGFVLNDSAENDYSGYLKEQAFPAQPGAFVSWWSKTGFVQEYGTTSTKPAWGPGDVIGIVSNFASNTAQLFLNGTPVGSMQMGNDRGHFVVSS